MKVETKAKVVMSCLVCLMCLVLCGCYEEQSYYMNKKRYFVPLEELIDAANRSEEIDEKTKQEHIEHYALVLYDTLNYVHKYSTKQIKNHVSRGELVIGMNQKEVLACLYTTSYRDGIPVPSKTYNSKYGKYETWIVGGSSGGNYSSYSPPKYALDFTYFILTGIHEPLDVLVKNLSDTNTPSSNDKYFKEANEAMGRMYYVLHSLEDEYQSYEQNAFMCQVK